MTNEFPSTHLSLLNRLESPDGEARNEAFQRFLQAYGPALAAVLSRHFGYGPGQASDMVGEFVSEKLVVERLAGKFLEAPAAARRSFRNYLAMSLKHFAIDRWKREQKRSDAEREFASARQFDDDIRCVMEAQWYLELITLVLRSTRNHYLLSGKLQHWDTFVRLRLAPVLRSTDRPTYRDAATAIGCDEDRVNSMMARVSVRLRLALAHVLRQESPGSSRTDIDLELQSVRTSVIHLLSRPELLTKLCVVDDPHRDATPFNSGNPDDWQSLLDVFDWTSDRYTDTELGSLLTYCLQEPLLSVSNALSTSIPVANPVWNRSLASIMAQHDLPLAELIELKRAITRSLHDPHSFVPRTVLLALRFTILALAIVRKGKVASNLSHDRLVEAFQHVLGYTWLTDECRLICQQALVELRDEDQHQAM